MTNIVYGLIDPIDKKLHYIGYTSEQNKRFIAHCRGDNGTKRKRIWIRHLKKLGLTPIMVVLREYTTANELPEAEKIWYNYYKYIGFDMYNDPDVIGCGFIKGHKMTVETKEKISLASQNMTIETKEKMSLAHKGKKISEETKVKISFANKGKSSPKKGKSLSEEVKAKMSSAQKDKTISVSAREKMSLAHKGKSHSTETRIKISLANTGKKHSTESISKMSEARKAYWHSKSKS